MLGSPTWGKPPFWTSPAKRGQTFPQESFYPKLPSIQEVLAESPQCSVFLRDMPLPSHPTADPGCSLLSKRLWNWQLFLRLRCLLSLAWNTSHCSPSEWFVFLLLPLQLQCHCSQRASYPPEIKQVLLWWLWQLHRGVSSPSHVIIHSCF